MRSAPVFRLCHSRSLLPKDVVQLVLGERAWLDPVVAEKVGDALGEPPYDRIVGFVSSDFRKSEYPVGLILFADVDIGQAGRREALDILNWHGYLVRADRCPYDRKEPRSVFRVRRRVPDHRGLGESVPFPAAPRTAEVRDREQRHEDLAGADGRQKLAGPSSASGDRSVHEAGIRASGPGHEQGDVVREIIEEAENKLVRLSRRALPTALAGMGIAEEEHWRTPLYLVEHAKRPSPRPCRMPMIVRYPRHRNCFGRLCHKIAQRRPKARGGYHQAHSLSDLQRQAAGRGAEPTMAREWFPDHLGA